MLYLRICLTFIYFQRLNWSSHEQPHLLELQYLVNPLEIYYENFQEVRRNNPALDKVFILWHASGTTHSQGTVVSDTYECEILYWCRGDQLAL